MATVTMSYNPDVPPPLPPARTPKENQHAALSRRPLPQLPSEQASVSKHSSGRPLPSVPTGEAKSPPYQSGRSFSLPHNHYTPPSGGGKGMISRHLSVETKNQHSPSSPVHSSVEAKRQLSPKSPVHVSVETKRQHNPTSPSHKSTEAKHQNTPASPVPPKLPPRKQSIDSHSQMNTAAQRLNSPPLPPRLSSLENLKNTNGRCSTHEYETRFHFHSVDDLPEPEQFRNTKKTYLSRTQNNSLKENRRKRAEDELPAC